jgi:integrase/recombinase XerC
MSEIAALQPVIRTWLFEGPLSSYVSAYVARLRRGRYAPTTVGHCLNGMAHFSHWMSQCSLPAQLLDEDWVDEFMQHHLPRCDCPGEAMRTPKSVHAALTALLEVLRECGVVAVLPTPTGPIADELRVYDTNMREARGLAEGTRRGYLRIIGRLLHFKFADRPVILGELEPEDVRRFISSQMEKLDSISNATTIAAALRAYLRYRATCGDAVQPLLAAIGSTANWSLASLPRALKTEEVDRLMSSFTATVHSYRRGYAVVRLALDLGLRSVEINRLQLTDIDWRMGTVSLKRTKTYQQDVLPLPVETGQALEAYIRHERPQTNSGAVFVRHHAPHDKSLGVDGIRAVVRDAFIRAGIPHGRSHSLRHTLACRIVNQGGSIKEVADVLRHRSLNTSLIYAKLDHGALAGVALPWPGSPQ